ncbi:MAG: hypothetical protein Q4D04_05475 [Clostridia bacterium]|nr:hypothetical protein [Clostridia bacterium]
MTPIKIIRYIISFAALLGILTLMGVNMLIAAPAAIVAVLAGGWGYGMWRKSVVKKLHKAVNEITAIKGVTATSRRECLCWSEKSLLSVIVDKTNEKIHFINYSFFGGIKNYYSYDIDELGCVAVYLNFDVKKRHGDEYAKDKTRSRKKKSLAIEIRTRNPGQPGGMSDIQLYPIQSMRLFAVPYKREDDDMLLFATQSASMAMDAIIEHHSSAIKNDGAEGRV